MEPADRSGNLLFSNHYFADITMSYSGRMVYQQQQVAKNFLQLSFSNMQNLFFTF